MEKSLEGVWYAAAGQYAAIIGASAIAAAVLCRKTLEFVSGFPPLDKDRRTGGADSASGTLDYPRHQGVFTKCAL